MTGCSSNPTAENAAGNCARAYAIRDWPAECEIQARPSSFSQPALDCGSSAWPVKCADASATGRRMIAVMVVVAAISCSVAAPRSRRPFIESRYQA